MNKSAAHYKVSERLGRVSRKGICGLLFVDRRLKIGSGTRSEFCTRRRPAPRIMASCIMASWASHWITSDWIMNCPIGFPSKSAVQCFRPSLFFSFPWHLLHSFTGADCDVHDETFALSN